MFDRIKLYVKTTRFKNGIWYSLIFLFLEIVIGSVIYFYLRGSLYKQLDLSLTGQANLIFDIVNEKGVDFYNFIPDSVYSSPADLIQDLAFEAVALNPTNTFIQVRFKDKIIFQTDNLKSTHTDLTDASNQSEFLTIHQHHGPHHFQALLAGAFNGLYRRSTGGGDIIDHHHTSAGRQVTLDPLGDTVVFLGFANGKCLDGLLLQLRSKCRCHGDGVGAEGQTAHTEGLSIPDGFKHQVAHQVHAPRMEGGGFAVDIETTQSSGHQFKDGLGAVCQIVFHGASLEVNLMRPVKVFTRIP